MDPDQPWEIEDPSESFPEDTPAAIEGGGAPGDAPPEDFPPPPEELTEAQRKKKFICTHWVRPKFLQYTYMENYRKNYYDDYINYLDKRNRGVDRDVPQPQTWAERALRTYTSHPSVKSMEYFPFARQAVCRHGFAGHGLVHPFTALHSKGYYHRKYYSILY